MSIFVGASPRTGFPSLSGLPWRTNLDEAYRGAREALELETNLSENLHAFLVGLNEDDLEYLLDRSTERSSHFKWCLGGRRHEFLVWLHQYKPPATFARATTFAASVHNHRYGFSSRVISGSLDVSWFGPGFQDGILPELARRRLLPGDVVSLVPDDKHRINAVGAGTSTLVLEGPPVRRQSTMYYLDRAQTEDFGDLESMFPVLLDQLATRGAE